MTSPPLHSASVRRALIDRCALQASWLRALPVGTPAFQVARVDAWANFTRQLMDELQTLPPADQDRWLLLNGSLQQHVAQMPFGCQWQCGSVGGEQGSGWRICHRVIAMRRATADSADHPPDSSWRPGSAPPPVRQLHTLPPSPQHMPTQHVISMCSCLKAFWRVDRPSRKELCPRWETL